MRYRNANIRVVLNGFIVDIGCQTVVAETTEKLLALISDYLADPHATEKRLLSNSMAYDGPIPACPNGIGIGLNNAAVAQEAAGGKVSLRSW